MSKARAANLLATPRGGNAYGEFFREFQGMDTALTVVAILVDVIGLVHEFRKDDRKK